MDTFELAKIAGAVLSALLVIVGFRTMLEIVEESTERGRRDLLWLNRDGRLPRLAFRRCFDEVGAR